MAGGHGGKRAGAGRKPRAEKYARPIARAEKRIADRLPELIDAQFDLALGVKVEEVNIVTGEPQVYTRPPDRQAGQYLIDRIMGKPVAQVEGDITGGLGATLAKTVDQAIDKVYGDGSEDTADQPGG